MVVGVKAVFLVELTCLAEAVDDLLFLLSP